MAGYMANPELGAEHVEQIEKKLAEAITGDGWLHSGDKGCLVPPLSAVSVPDLHVN
jgi:long-subunit acyl-CoA synthetase (AMP-forming)